MGQPLANGNLSDPGTWDTGVVPNALTNVTIPAGVNITVDSDATLGSLNLAAGGTLTMNANLTLNGQLTLGTQINTGANTLALGCSSTVTGASSSNFIIGNLQKDFCATGAFTYPVGTAGGYSLVTTNVTALGQIPSALTIKANETVPPELNAGSSAARYWALTETGDMTVNLTFNYLDGDVNGDESTYKLYRITGGAATQVTATLNTAANTIAATGISQFSNWGIGNSGSAPTATTLTNFSAKHSAKKNVVRVKWETGSELNVVGFNVYRATKKDGAFKKLNKELVAAKHAGEIQGDKYKHANKKVKPGENYFYKLEIVLADGTREWSELIKVRVP